MDQRHRRIIQKSRSLFIADLLDIERVCDKLYEFSVLTTGMKEEILAEKTREGKVRTLLDIIPKRGRHAYAKFHQVLVDTQHQELADILRPELATREDIGKPQFVRSLTETSFRPKLCDIKPCAFSQSMISLKSRTRRTDFDTNLPREWPSEEELAKHIDFVVASIPPFPSADYKDIHLDTSPSTTSHPVYPMDSKPKGTVLIIDNSVFDTKLGFPERTERSSVDSSSIEILFKQLDFNISMYSNITFRQMTEIIGKESERDHSTESCFILFIMSYGQGDTIYDVEGYPVPLDNIISMFDSEHCPSLIGKPKLFFIQACRAHLTSDHSKVDDGDDVFRDVIGDEALLSLVSDQTSAPNDLDLQRVHPPLRIDMFIARAVIDVSIKYQKTPFGSKFIQALVIVMRKRACVDDLLTIMTRVNELATRSSGKEHELVVEFQSTLTKNLNFMI